MRRTSLLSKLPVEMLEAVRANRRRALGELAQDYGLNVWERRTLAVVLRGIGSEPFSAGKLRELARRDGMAAGVEAGLSGLVRQGILFRLRRGWGEFAYLLPEDDLPDWHSRLLGLPPAPQANADDRVPARPFLSDLLELLHGIDNREIAPTRGGTIPRRHVQALEERMQSRPEAYRAFEEAVRRSGLDGAYSARFAVVLDAGVASGLIDKTDSPTLKIREAGLNRWLSEPPEDFLRGIAMRWLRFLRPEPLGLRHVWPLVWPLPAGRIVSSAEWREWLAKHLAGCFDGAQLEAAERGAYALLLPLAELGLAHLSGDRDGREWSFAWAVPPEEAGVGRRREGTVLVQPDFEVVVPPDAPLFLQWELRNFGRCLQLDTVGRYRLSREAFDEAAAKGRSPDAFLQALNRHAQYGVPPTVADHLRSWANRSVGERGSAAEPAATEPVLARAESADAAGAEGFSRLAAAPGLLGGRSDSEADTLQPATELPDLEEVYPGLGDIPRMWTESMRDYHAGTRKAFVRKAIEWKALIDLKLGGGTVRFEPLELQENAGEWTVEGLVNGQPRAISGQEWESMRLILPCWNEI